MGKSWCWVGAAVAVAGVLWVARAGEEPGRGDKVKLAESALIKRGEYLVNKVAHCSHCHTPQAKGKPDRSRLLRGATLPIRPREKTEHWADRSPDITRGGLAGEWSEEQMVKFLTTGRNPHGEGPTPPMPVFRLHREDARAVTLYLRSLGGKKKGKGGGGAD